MLTFGTPELAAEENRQRVLHLTCCLLPKSHRDSLEILFSFLVWASSFSQVDEESGSKMDTHNLATVIAPNILKEKPTANVNMDDSSFLAIEAVNCLIEFNDQMCEVSSLLLLMRRRLCSRPLPGSRRFTVHSQRLLPIQQKLRSHHQRDPPALR